MKNLNLEVEKIILKFGGLNPENSSILLKHQHAWKEWNMQNVFKHDNKEAIENEKKGITTGWFEYKDLEIDQEEIRKNNPFRIVIKEWINEVPIFKFQSIGEYISFMKAIYFEKIEIAHKILSGSEIYRTRFNLTAEEIQEWRNFKSYYTYKAVKVINLSKAK